MNETIVWAWQALPIGAASPILVFQVGKVWNHPWWLSPVLFCTEQHTVSNQYFFCSLKFLIHMLRKLHVLYSSRYTLQNLRYTQECTFKAPCLHPICLSLSLRITEWALLYNSSFVCRNSPLCFDSPAGAQDTGSTFIRFCSACLTPMPGFSLLLCSRIAYLNSFLGG